MDSLAVFLTFDGDCNQALSFYAKVFKQEIPQIMTYGQNPGGAAEADKDRILYACMPIGNRKVMFSDCPSGFQSVKGNNIMLALELHDAEEVKRIYHALAERGTIGMKLEKTFFSELFGMVTDQFGIIWQLSKISDH
jgi:PhnB protein